MKKIKNMSKILCIFLLVEMLLMVAVAIYNYNVNSQQGELFKENQVATENLKSLEDELESLKDRENEYNPAVEALEVILLSKPKELEFQSIVINDKKKNPIWIVLKMDSTRTLDIAQYIANLKNNKYLKNITTEVKDNVTTIIIRS